MRSVFLARPKAASLYPASAGKRVALTWGPALFGVLVIVMESTNAFSAEHTGGFLRPLVQGVFGVMSDPTWEKTHHIIRKSGHFLGYGSLCILFLRAWLLTFASRLDLPDAAWKLRSWALALASTFLVASADEFHQSFLPSRTGKFADVVLDTCGGIVLSSIWLGVSRLLSRAQTEPVLLEQSS